MTKSKLTVAAATSVVTTALLCTGFLIAWTLGATTTDSISLSHSRFTLTESSNSKFFHMSGIWICYLDGTFGGSSITLTKLDSGGVLSPTTKAVNVAAFVGATTNVNYAGLEVGIGLYRFEVTGGASTSVTADCSRSRS